MNARSFPSPTTMNSLPVLKHNRTQKTRFLILEGRESDVIVTARAWNVNSAQVAQAVSSHPELEGSVVTVAGVDGAGGASGSVLLDCHASWETAGGSR